MWLELERKVGEKMRQIPLGYRIEHGQAKIDEAGAAQVRTLFAAYIDGNTLYDAAEKAGISGSHSSIGRILKNKRYLGDDYYPALIDKETFEQAQEIRLERAEKLGRNYDYTDSSEPVKQENITFTLRQIPQKYEDPYEQAVFAYSLIETEKKDGK